MTYLKSGGFVTFVIGVVLLACVAPSAAGPFPASQWQYRSSIGLNNASGTENLVDFPVLVKLDSGNFDFTKAKSDGSDIRFADANNVALSYEIEQWNATGQQAAVWVKLPQVDQASGTDQFHMLYGNPAAVDAQNAAAVWSNGYKGVWHMDGSSTAYDSTSGGHDGAVIGGGVSSASGAIGDARSFSSGSYISARNTDLGGGASSLDADNNISITYWMKAASADQTTYYTRTLCKDSGPGWQYQKYGWDPPMGVRIDAADPNGGNNQVKLIGSTAYDDTWHYIGVTIGGTPDSTGTATTFFDGNSPGSHTYNHGAGFGNTTNLLMGTGEGKPLTGSLDEVRFSDVVRSDAWMNAEYRSQTGALASTGSAVDRQSDARTGLVAQYTHEWPDPLADTTGHGHDATNHGVSFVAAPNGGGFQLGDTVGSYNRGANDYLDVPTDVVELGESFTFTSLVWRDDNPNTGYQTILGSDRFRFQWSSDTREADTCRLRLDVNSGGGGGVSASGFFELEKWYMAVLRYDADTNTGQAFLLAPGDTVGTPAFSFSPGTPFDLTALRIGADGLSGIGSFDGWAGLIDGSRFYGSYLDNQQLQDVLTSYVPEPSSCLLLVLGAIGLALRRRRSRSGRPY